MKIIAFAFVVLLAGVSAVPYEVSDVGVKDQKFIDDVIIGLIERIIELIQERGLDPLEVDELSGEYTFPVPGIFRGSAYIKDVLVTGLSNIVINDVSISRSTLNVDISIPRLEASVGDAAAEVRILSRDLNGQLSGRLAINEIRLAAQVELGFTGYLLEDLKLSCSLGGIESELNVNIFGRDISDILNKFLGETLPGTLIEYEDQLNRLVAKLILYLIDRIF